MPDWRAIVEQRLALNTLEAAQRTEVAAELAGHLEEHFEELRAQGVSEKEAIQQTLRRAGDWRRLCREIEGARSEEDEMTDRVRQFWLPGLVTLLLSMLLLMAIQFVGPRPRIVSLHGWRMMAPVAVIYVPWLVSLIPIGAVGAYLADRAGGSRRTKLLAIIFPVLPYLALFVIAFPVSLILDDHVAHNIMFGALLTGFLAWILLPAIPLLAGGLAPQLIVSRRSTRA